MNSLLYLQFMIGVLIALSSGIARAQEQVAQIYMPDGQFVNYPVRVYISGIDDSALVNPRLCLVTLKKKTLIWKTRPIL